MKRLNKKMLAKKQDLEERLNSAEERVFKKVEDFNEARTQLWHEKVVPKMEELRDAIQEFNGESQDLATELEGEFEDLAELYSEASDFIDSVYEEMDCFISEKSERWVDSDKGTNFQAWAEAWNGVNVDLNYSIDFEEVQEPDPAEPDEIPEPDFSLSEEFAQLPEEMEE